ncbi:hypothetical protein NUU61_008654 [Penicillium alfredii]|uniref:Uncharacterized protein n=1 Tax=Penicillium alfredii TaxID=1506179 RepID=A0A9W9JWI1_9EURO|nr:uncharacterized protein NUU61_008654 [Penicillium alfredii]KAJ5084075.1 hypothetical protein NUU61_008654 [Penicillium alfredii]
MADTSLPQAQRLLNKVAVVTGAASGLGRAISLLYAAHGAKLVCADLRPDIDPERSGQAPEPATHDLILARGGQAVFFQCDVTKAEQVAALVAEAVKHYGKLDIMVNNAGVNVESLEPAIIHEASEELFDKTLAINTKGVFLGSKYATAQMLKQEPHANGDRGWIVNVASIMGLVGLESCPGYCASKSAVVGLTRNIALDYAPHRIHCNAIAPGYTQTPMLNAATKLIPPEALGPIHALHPFKGLGEPDDIARAALFLASEDASWITGQCLAVDGGFTTR